MKCEPMKPAPPVTRTRISTEANRADGAQKSGPAHAESLSFGANPSIDAGKSPKDRVVTTPMSARMAKLPRPRDEFATPQRLVRRTSSRPPALASACGCSSGGCGVPLHDVGFGRQRRARRADSTGEAPGPFRFGDGDQGVVGAVPRQCPCRRISGLRERCTPRLRSLPVAPSQGSAMRHEIRTRGQRLRQCWPCLPLAVTLREDAALFVWSESAPMHQDVVWEPCGCDP